VAEGTSLLRMHTAYTCIVSSNLTVSASIKKKAPGFGSFFFRHKARQCRLLLTDGKDPIIARVAARTADALGHARFETFGQCATADIKAHRGSWKSAKRAVQWETSLAAYASPVFGSLPVSDIDTDLVVGALRPIWDTKTEQRPGCVGGVGLGATRLALQSRQLDRLDLLPPVA
jgi:hypothetical protein